MRSLACVVVTVVAGCSGGNTSTVTPASVPPAPSPAAPDAGVAPAAPSPPPTVASDMSAPVAGGNDSGTGSDGGAVDGGTSACAPATPEAIVADHATYIGAEGFAVDDRSAYVITRVGKFNDYVLYRDDKSGGGTQVVYWGPVSSGGTAATLAMDGDFLFVLPYVGGGWDRWNKDGSNHVNFTVDNDALRAVVADGGRLYAASSTSGTIYAIDETTGALTTLAQQQNQPSALVSDGSYIYFNTDSRILRVAKTGGAAPETVIASAGGGASAIAVDDAHVYFGDRNGTLFVGGKLPGSTAMSIAQSGFAIDRLIADGNKLYAATNTRPPDPTSLPFDQVVSLGKDGRDIRVLDPRADLVFTMTTDAQYLYYTGWELMRVCK